VGILFRLILQGILAYVLKKGAVSSSRAAVSTGLAIIQGGARAAADETLAEVSALLRKSKLPDGFAVWIEKNWDDLKRNPKLITNNMASIGNSRSAPAAITPSQLKASGNQRTADLTRATPAEQSPVARPVSKSVEQDKTLLDSQGVPIGARQGLAKPGLPAETLTKEGWPDLPGEHVQNFNSVEPVTLKPGTKIYRIIDDFSNPAGGYWAEELPAGRAQWRGDYAVKLDWNTNGKYVEYTVPEGTGLNVWKGETSAQALQGSGGYNLPGGAQQIWMPPNTVTPGAAKSTGW